MLDTVTATTDLNAVLRDEAHKLGLDAIGIARLGSHGTLAERLDYFLKHGRHGDMDWMEENADRRGDPNRLWPEAKTAIMVGQSYAPPSNPLDALEQRDRGVISVYAKGRDYHDIIKKKIKSLARTFAAKSGADVKVFVDTDPDIRIIRRIVRDIKDRGRDIDSVVEQYLTTVRPMHMEFVEPSKRFADIVIPGYPVPSDPQVREEDSP